MTLGSSVFKKLQKYTNFGASLAGIFVPSREV